MKAAVLGFASLLVLSPGAVANRPWDRLLKIVVIEEDSTKVFGWSFRSGQAGMVQVVGDEGCQLEVRVYDGRRLVAQSPVVSSHHALVFRATSDAVHTIQVRNVGSRPCEFRLEVYSRGDAD